MLADIEYDARIASEVAGASAAPANAEAAAGADDELAPARGMLLGMLLGGLTLALAASALWWTLS